MTTKKQSGQKAPCSLIPFLAAIQFLLVSPAFIRRPFSSKELGHSVGYFPLVGLILGLILAGSNWLIALLFPDLLRAALILGLWVGLTGALHLDGFLDTCDGLLGGYDPEHRLQIMKDERVGAYALAGGILLILIKFSAIYSLERCFAAFILAPVVGHWIIALVIIAFPYARHAGLGRALKDHAGLHQAIISTIFTLVTITGLGFFGAGLASLVAVAAAALSAGIILRYSLSRLPGLTGDIYGALCEVTEAVILIVMAAF